jgi:hypothetical protein
MLCFYLAFSFVVSAALLGSGSMNEKKNKLKNEEVKLCILEFLWPTMSRWVLESFLLISAWA